MPRASFVHDLDSRARRQPAVHAVIAAQLTNEGLPTPNGGPAWSWGTIVRVVRRKVKEPIRHRKRAL